MAQNTVSISPHCIREALGISENHQTVHIHTTTERQAPNKKMRTSKQTNKQTNNQTNNQTSKQTNKQANKQTDKRTTEQTNRQTKQLAN